MVSFWNKLRGKKPEEEKGKSAQKGTGTEEGSDGVLQLDVDIYQNDYEIIIYAPVPGVEIENLDILMEGDDDDVIIIQGKRERPEIEEDSEGKWLVQECRWGSFFRQIILPREVDSSRIEAKLKEGVLILKLPLLGKKARKTKVRITDIK
jgi:HSP20 family molecular chaperone IbpA